MQGKIQIIKSKEYNGQAFIALEDGEALTEIVILLEGKTMFANSRLDYVEFGRNKTKSISRLLIAYYCSKCLFDLQPSIVRSIPNHPFGNL